MESSARPEQLLFASSHVVIDDTDFPVVTARFVGVPDRAEFGAFLEGALGLLRRRQPFVTIIDARQGGMLPFAYIKDAGAWLTQHGRTRAVYSRGTALVLPGPVQRTVLSAVLALAPMGDTYEVFKDVAAASAWAVRVLGRPIALGD